MSEGVGDLATPRGTVDDVALASSGDGRLWLCASWSSLDREEVWFGEVLDGRMVAPLPVGGVTSSFRPGVVAWPGGVLAVALAPGCVHGLVRRGDEVRRWTMEVEGRPWQADLAVDGEGEVWLALEIHQAGRRSIRVAVVDVDRGSAETVAHARGEDGARWPAIAAAGRGALLAWSEGSPAQVRAAHVDRGRGLGQAILVGDGDAPALAVDASQPPGGPDAPDAPGAVLAWHVGGVGSAADHRDASVRRTLRIARWDVAGGTVAPGPEPPPGAGELEPSGEDQGWELPAVAVDGDGGVWLAGRSSHGHHLARLDRAGTWSGRGSLCDGAWGGRGRRLALVRHGDGVWIARRRPEGIEVRACERPGGAAPAQPPVPAASRARLAASPRRHDVLFGDLHQHTAHSDGCGSAEDLWHAARLRGLDFAAITDHDQFCRRALGPATWEYLCELAHDADRPGRFAAFPGYEFTGMRYPGPGHKCVYFGDRVPARVPDKDVDAIFAVCRELGAIAVPHHVGWTGGDFSHHDPAIQPVWEICSVHGCYTGDDGCGDHQPRADHVIPGQFVHDALAAGLRFGFIGSTDSHGLDWHHGIARWRNPFRSGLACVFGAEPTRASILDAIRARRTYATSGARIVLRAEVEGAPMGSELPAGTGGQLAVEVEGTAPIARAVLVLPGREIVFGGAPEPRATFRHPVPEAAWFYVRVEQADREVAWSSPFWR